MVEGIEEAVEAEGLDEPEPESEPESESEVVNEGRPKRNMWNAAVQSAMSAWVTWMEVEIERNAQVKAGSHED